MSSAARIEELQKKFDENPRRYFAPLANECRKAGELDAAIAICRAHLPQQPGHMSGHIVYGQALYESGELAEARTVFETALGLDPENLIALRHMGDIAAHDGKVAEARKWYARVLETDPRNEEIQALVAGLGAVGDGPAADAAEGLPSLIDPELLAVAAEAYPDDTESPFASGADDVVPTAFADVGPGDSPATLNLDGFEATSFDEPDGAATQPGVAPIDDIDQAFADREPPDVAATGSLLDVEPEWGSPIGEAAAEMATGDVAPDGVEPASDAFATETMAELYLSQGYREQAIGVYRQLVAQQPGDEALRVRLARLEQEADAAGGTGIPGLPEALEPELLAAAADAEVPAEDAESTATSPAVAAGGVTIREFLAALALGRAAVPHPPATVADLPERAVEAPVASEGSEVAQIVDLGREVEAADATRTQEADLIERTPDGDRFVSAGAADPSALLDLEGGFGEVVDVETGDDRASAAGLDTLFGAVGDARDAQAADVLSRAFASGHGAAPAGESAPDPLSGRPARPAGNDLSLDSVFGGPRQPGAARNTGGFSFDQFFADGAVKTPREEAAEPRPPADDDEDLEQFNSWLHGLKNQ